MLHKIFMAVLVMAIAAYPVAAQDSSGTEESKPCPEGAEKALLTTMIGLSSGQYDDLGKPYGIATAAVAQCPDNGFALGLAASMLADIGMRLGKAQSDQAPRVLVEAYEAVIAQDNAPAQEDVTVKVGQYEPITYSTEGMRADVDEMLKTNLMLVLVGGSRDYTVGSRLRKSIETCPYSSRDQLRALREAEGIVSALETNADGYNHGAPLARLEALRLACGKQARPLALQEMQALMDMAEKLDDLDRNRDASCLADEGLALIEKYRAESRPDPDEAEAANLSKLKAWEETMKRTSVVTCPDAD
ncbi:MAG: hypothetical protein RIB03_05100 [Henriciella sp.]|uniref:hypothetical protein n=1 Tax=Henriciella sp. TaxID=1968823 RepID=UPI0032EB5312